MAADLPSVNERRDTSPTTLAANPTGHPADPAPVVGNSRCKRRRAASSTSVLTVSLVVPVKNDAANIAWVRIGDGNSTDATLITARSCRPDITVVPGEGSGKGSALRAGLLAAYHPRYLKHLRMSADGFEITAVHELESYCTNIGGVEIR